MVAEPSSWIEKVSLKDFDLSGFKELTLVEEDFRTEVVDQMIHNPQIMVYYHCFYILDAASVQNPDLFYHFWKDICVLLDHSNSYKRDFALTILATLSAVDKDDHFADIEEQYFSLLFDKKFMTALCCIRNLTRVLSRKPEMLPRVMTLLLRHEKNTPYSASQEALFNAEILTLIQQEYTPADIPPVLCAFIERQKSSRSHKARNQAKKLFSEFSV
jgi:hypothetical protein